MNINVKNIRSKTGLSQKEFSKKYGFSFGAVRDWEQGRREPEYSAKILLHMIDINPIFVEHIIDGINNPNEFIQNYSI